MRYSRFNQQFALDAEERREMFKRSRDNASRCAECGSADFSIIHDVKLKTPESSHHAFVKRAKD